MDRYHHASYTYDAVGNRLTMSIDGNETKYNYNGLTNWSERVIRNMSTMIMGIR